MDGQAGQSMCGKLASNKDPTRYYNPEIYNMYHLNNYLINDETIDN